MKREFKVGDRVRSYNNSGYLTGEIIFILENGILRLQHYKEKEHEFEAHPKQCRHLVKKKRMEVWFCWSGDGPFGRGFAFFDEAKDYAVGQGLNPSAVFRLVVAKRDKND